ncbi:hypothetical protein C8R45DRAFT_1075507 [Mycena sanguinolenta]|nr:hypothetical protein C8R45DRAFT_1075507 [Mycena sanguinolenta]
MLKGTSDVHSSGEHANREDVRCHHHEDRNGKLQFGSVSHFLVRVGITKWLNLILAIQISTMHRAFWKGSYVHIRVFWQYHDSVQYSCPMSVKGQVVSLPPNQAIIWTKGAGSSAALLTILPRLMDPSRTSGPEVEWQNPATSLVIHRCVDGLGNWPCQRLVQITKFHSPVKMDFFEGFWIYQRTSAATEHAIQSRGGRRECKPPQQPGGRLGRLLPLWDSAVRKFIEAQNRHVNSREICQLTLRMQTLGFESINP